MGKTDKCRTPPATHSNDCSSVSDSTEEIRASILGEEENHEKKKMNLIAVHQMF